MRKGAVSYTHLDVYKRQVQERVANQVLLLMMIINLYNLNLL